MPARHSSDSTRPRPRPSRPEADAEPAASGSGSGRQRLVVKAAIATGVLVLAGAAVAGAVSGSSPASSSTDKPAALKGTPNVLPIGAAASSSSAAAAAARAAVLPAVPIKHVKPAPATKAVISGLAANGIPNVALNAYRVAAARMAAVQPSCGIQWWLLAGIGREESDHGRFGGARLGADGVSVPKIIGPPLNGHGTEYIPAPSDGAALAGDAVYTRALGPMQFIPQTWAMYGTDANGDGVADIFNINDAALSAARYLCAAGGDLRTLAGQQRAILAYNHSTEYLNQVLALANAYRTGVPVSGPPVGITSGTLPPVTYTGPIPVVNPGPPTAVSSGRGGGSTTGSKSGTKSGTKSGGGGTTSGSGGTKSGSGGTKSGSGGTKSGGGGTKSGGGGVITTRTSSVPKPPAPTPTSSAPKLPIPLPSIPLPVPTPTKSKSQSKTPAPSPSPTKTCIVNLIGVCI